MCSETLQLVETRISRPIEYAVIWYSWMVWFGFKPGSDCRSNAKSGDGSASVERPEAMGHRTQIIRDKGLKGDG